MCGWVDGGLGCAYRCSLLVRKVRVPGCYDWLGTGLGDCIAEGFIRLMVNRFETRITTTQSFIVGNMRKDGYTQ